MFPKFRGALAKSAAVTRVFGLAVIASVALGIGTPARASVIINIFEVGTGVEVTASGTLDTTNLTYIGTGAYEPYMQPNAGLIILGLAGSGSANSYVLTPLLPDGQTFGSGGVSANANTGTGNLVGVCGVCGGNTYLFVPEFYSSGTALTADDLYLGATLVSLGVTPGTYTWTWGSENHADYLTIVVGSGPSETPLPAALPLFATGLGALGLLSWRGRRKKGAALAA